MLLPHQPNFDFVKPYICRNILANKLVGIVFYQEDSRGWIELMDIQLTSGLVAEVQEMLLVV